MSEIKERKTSAAKLHHTPLSNTGCGAYLIPEANCLIDYVKVQFPFSFNVQAPVWTRILEVLKVDANVYDHDEIYRSGYLEGYFYDANVVILTGGNQGRADELETSVLELKGQACREFERRDGSWKDLLGILLDNCIINSVPGDVQGRFDTAIDSINGRITYKNLANKVKRRDYVTCTRSLKSIESGGEIAIPRIDNYKGGGWSFTFGGTATKQLCIYDKLKEREANDREVFVESWIRYEARFFRRGAYDAMRHVYAALCMKEDSQAVARVISGLVRGIIEFKETNEYDLRNKSKARPWSRWVELLDSAKALKVVNQSRLELTLSKLCRHVDVSYGKALRKTELYNRDNQRVYEAWLKYHGGMRITNREVAALNYAREEQHLPPLTRESILKNTREMYEWAVEAPADIPLERFYMDEKGNRTTVDGEVIFKNKRKGKRK